MSAIGALMESVQKCSCREGIKPETLPEEPESTKLH
jgi:hypothetical protein